MKKWEKFSDEKIKQFVEESNNFNELAKKLGYVPNSGSNIKTIQEMLIQKQIDFSHFSKNSWNKGKIDFNKFKKNTKPSKRALKNLITLRGHKCEKCLNTNWFSELIPLQVHHIDGDRNNNELNNLQLLCPNCHALTNNFCIKNYQKNKKIDDETLINTLKKSNSINNALQKLKLNTSRTSYKRAYKLIKQNNIHFITIKKKKNICCDCGVLISKNAIRCLKCEYKRRKHIERPSREKLKQLIRTNSFVAIGKQYGFSDNAIRKWCDDYNLPRKKKEINSYSDEEWDLI